jgi:hypothetical protein
MSRTRSSQLIKVLKEEEDIIDPEEQFEIPEYSYIEVPSTPVIGHRRQSSIIVIEPRDNPSAAPKGLVKDNNDEVERLKAQLNEYETKEKKEKEEQFLKGEITKLQTDKI